MTLLVRDEADVVEANLDYHLSRGVDFVIATDHASRDGTAALLRRYEQDGVLQLLRAEGEAHDQVTHVNAMARAAAVDHGADWVINNDADEFWWPIVGGLKDLLSAVPEHFGALEVPRSNFLPRPGGRGSFLERMVVRETASTNGLGEALEPKIVHRGTADISMAPGNHAVTAPDLVVAPDLGLLEVLHLPVRTFEQFERKVLNVGTGYERLEGRQHDVGRDQLALLRLQREGRLRAYFDDLVLDDAALAVELAGGRLVIDPRLRDYLAAVGPGGTEDQPADALVAARVVSRALGMAAELDSRRSEFERRSAELAEAGAELAEARAELDEARGRLEQLSVAVADRELAERQLASTAATLRALQSSRLMRVSQPLRKLYYGLRGTAKRNGSP